ncbi:hypothetical protein SpCBS45565_g07019 [Spizellomyces sp. 'palustris']|nr:hypothetical protein SpCBS45565_g07019 [Spizellomyces sp. 'palustris']
MSSQKSLRVLYIHGRQSSKNTPKLVHLSKYFTTHCVEYTAEQAADYESIVRQQARAIKDFQPDVIVGSSYGGSVTTTLVQRGFEALAAARQNPEKARRVLISGEESVIGGDEDIEGWVGPVVLLAPAHLKRIGMEDKGWWPTEAPAKIIHGLQDDIVPIEDSRILAKSLKSFTQKRINLLPMRFVELVEVEDGHRLESLATGNLLIDAVTDVANTWGRAKAFIPMPVNM